MIMFIQRIRRRNVHFIAFCGAIVLLGLFLSFYLVPSETHFARSISNKKTVLIAATNRTFHPSNDRVVTLLNVGTAKSSPRYCQIALGDLVWTADTSYSDLWQLCETKGRLFHDASAVLPIHHKPNIVVMNHLVPKTGSTSVRNTVLTTTTTNHQKHHLSEDETLSSSSSSSCPQLHKFAFLTDCDELTHFLATTCPSRRFWFHWSYNMKTVHVPQGRNPSTTAARPPCFDHALSLFLVRTVAFRSFRDWAHSAMQQMVKKHRLSKDSEKEADPCDVLTDQFSRCETGHMELDYRKYSKSILGVVARESWDNDALILYDYKNTSYMMTEFMKLVGQEPFDMQRKKNNKHFNATCPRSVLDLFHSCFDDRLANDDFDL